MDTWKFRSNSLKDLGGEDFVNSGSGSGLENNIGKQEKKAFKKAGIEKHPVKSFDTNPDEPLGPIVEQSFEDYSSKKGVPKGKYLHEGKYNPEEKKEVKYIRSKDLMKYSKLNDYNNPDQVKFATKILDYMGTKELLNKLHSGNDKKLLEYPNPITKNNDTMSVSHMPEKTEPKIKTPTTNTEAEGAENLELIKEVYKIKDRFAKELGKTIVGNKTKNEDRKRDLENFNNDPYETIIEELKNNLRKNEDKEKKLKAEGKNRSDWEKTKTNIREILNDIGVIKSAFEKRLPLKLDRNFTENEIKISGDEIFDTSVFAKELNGYLMKRDEKYKIFGVIQRGFNQYLVLNTENGEKEEIKLEDIKEMIKRKEGRENSKEYKQKQFDQIKKGSIVKVRIGGKKGNITTYEITDINDKEIIFKNLTKKHEGNVRMSIDGAKALLFGRNNGFYVEENINNKNKVVEDKTKPVPNTKKEDENSNTPSNETKKIPDENPNINVVKKLEEELGFIIDNSAILARYLKISSKEAERLLEEYRSTKDNPETVTQTSDTGTVETETTEKSEKKDTSTPVIEEVALFNQMLENLKKKDQLRINLEKELEEIRNKRINKHKEVV